MRVPWTRLGTVILVLIFKLVQRTRVKLPEHVQRKFSSVFSELAANYEEFCQMMNKILNLNIKMTRQKKNLKPVSVH
jgi:hypothetical protein